VEVCGGDMKDLTEDEIKEGIAELKAIFSFNDPVFKTDIDDVHFLYAPYFDSLISLGIIQGNADSQGHGSLSSKCG
jgi:hypothetical protein